MKTPVPTHSFLVSIILYHTNVLFDSISPVSVSPNPTLSDSILLDIILLDDILDRTLLCHSVLNGAVSPDAVERGSFWCIQYIFCVIPFLFESALSDVVKSVSVCQDVQLLLDCLGSETSCCNLTFTDSHITLIQIRTQKPFHFFKHEYIISSLQNKWKSSENPCCANIFQW